MRIVSVVGTRPNFVKLGTVHRALAAAGHDHVVVHTGQHYDVNMSDVFFRDLALPAPDAHLGVEPGPAALQTARILEGLQEHLPSLRPDWILCYGDVTSTPATALAARLIGIRSAHVESGYRSFDRTMPEEINRIVTDHVSDLLLAPDRTAEANLVAERVDRARIRVVGSANIDALLFLLAQAPPPTERLPEDPYGVLTLHRPGNVDDPSRLRSLLEACSRVASDLPLVFPVHPRTRTRLESAGIKVPSGLRVVEPIAYGAFLRLVRGARVVVTDSGGLQEEAAYLGVPCLVLRDTSERPALVESGSTVLVGTNPAAIEPAWRHLCSGPTPSPWRDEGTDGRTGERIVGALESWP